MSTHKNHRRPRTRSAREVRGLDMIRQEIGTASRNAALPTEQAMVGTVKRMVAETDPLKDLVGDVFNDDIRLFKFLGVSIINANHMYTALRSRSEQTGLTIGQIIIASKRDSLSEPLEATIDKPIRVGVINNIKGTRYIGLSLTPESRDQMLAERAALCEELGLKEPSARFMPHLSLGSTLDADVAKRTYAGLQRLNLTGAPLLLEPASFVPTRPTIHIK